jgi:hypothetical protein
MSELKTNPKLLDALRQAASVKQSANEVREQRVSYIYGSVNEKSGLTRDRIRQAVNEEEGTAG